MTPGPPPLVTMARRLPVGLMWVDSARAEANSCRMVLTRTTPARRTSASNTASDPTSAPVCDCTALEPVAWRPTLTMTMGLKRDVARNALMKRRASRMPSM